MTYFQGTKYETWFHGIIFLGGGGGLNVEWCPNNSVGNRYRRRWVTES